MLSRRVLARPDQLQTDPANWNPSSILAGRRVCTKMIPSIGYPAWPSECLARIAKVALGGFAGVFPNAGQAIVG